MLASSSLFLALAILPASLIASHLPYNINTTPKHPERRDVTTYSRKYQKNCGGSLPYNLAEFEEEAWDTAQVLARAAQKWVKGGAYQQTADFWFGSGSDQYYDRIMANFINADKFHDHSIVGSDDPLDNSYFEVWCNEVGPDGTVPRPDGATGTWNPPVCRNTVKAYSFSRVKWWWFSGPVYYTVLCPAVWEQTSNVSKRTLEVVQDDILNNFSGGKNVDLTMNEPYRVRGSTYLHEILHHEVVSNPGLVDVTVVGPNWAPNAGLQVYGPENCAALAKLQGPLQTGLQNPPNGGGYNGEFGAILNADNYNNFALSVYFQELLQRSDPIQPSNPDWKKIPAGTMAPNKRRTIDLSSQDFEVYQENTAIALDDPTTVNNSVDLPVDPNPVTVEETNYPEPPPNPPTCNATGSTSTSTASPALVSNLGAVYCKSWPAPQTGSAYPAQPPSAMKSTLTQSNLTPQVANAELSVTFDFQPGPPLAGCYMGCEDMYPNLITYCQSDSTTIKGTSIINQQCGNFTITIN